ncbi:hypothetical protein CALVIDRAFT_190131 [Calocera viscosa TUFC12733]|uniref:Uncharacterized protein n=1 Tax=Calocera viscosa (strain TUFC12733) TaxID=1330018 RepID=A0A167KM96_CALVF|nr:hypothetical protein CALVIDRAFT_190131 [Calocera viscosa TUFC12733]
MDLGHGDRCASCLAGSIKAQVDVPCGCAGKAHTSTRTNSLPNNRGSLWELEGFASPPPSPAWVPVLLPRSDSRSNAQLALDIDRPPPPSISANYLSLPTLPRHNKPSRWRPFSPARSPTSAQRLPPQPQNET